MKDIHNLPLIIPFSHWKNGFGFPMLLIYVDDLILADISLAEFLRIKVILGCKIKIKDLWVLKYFLGFEVAHSKSSITISQGQYCLDLLNDPGLLGFKPSASPIDPFVKLH